MMDVGINNQDIGLSPDTDAQLILFVSQMTVEFFRGWILLHLTTRLNIS